MKAAVIGEGHHARLDDLWEAVLRQYSPEAIRMRASNPFELAALRAAAHSQIPHQPAVLGLDALPGELLGMGGRVLVFTDPASFRAWLLEGANALITAWDGLRYGPVWDCVWQASAQGLRIINLAELLKKP